MIGEYDQANNPIREYVYLNGLPVALISNEKPDEVLNIHTDHLGTPRAVSDASNEILWRWEGDQFGDVEPQVSLVTMPLRHAGQYHDKETNLFYNYFRFYDPKTGRYVTSDPIGLQGGMNTYGYVGGNPLIGVDPLGLIVKWEGSYREGSLGYKFVDFKKMEFNLRSQCVNSKRYTVKVHATGAVFVSDFSILGPVSLGNGGATFYENSDEPNPNSFNGSFALGQIARFNGIFEGFTEAGGVVLGSNLGDLRGLGESSDLFAVEMGGGKSKVISVKEESCCNE